jgi:L-ascorbate metabolism protein UlaG (beta-lactamase superfamily)
MMPAPLSAAELPEVDFVFCTHHHGDHLDGPTLKWIAAAVHCEISLRRLVKTLKK